MAHRHLLAFSALLAAVACSAKTPSVTAWPVLPAPPTAVFQPLESAFVVAGGKAMRCDIGMSPQADLEFVLQEIDPNRPAQALGPATTLTARFDVPGVCGVVDLIELPDGDLLFGCTAILGLSHGLYLVRIGSATTPTGETVRRVTMVASVGEVPTTTRDGGIAPALYYDGVALHATPTGVSAFVGAHLTADSASKVDSTVVEIAFDVTLSDVRSARWICDGSDPRVRATPDGIVLAARHPRDGSEGWGASRMVLCESSDGVAWKARADVPTDLRVRPDYALGVSGRSVRIATPTEEPFTAVIWSSPVDGSAWQRGATFPLEQEERPGQRPRIWSPHARMGEAGSQHFVLLSKSGFVLH